LAAADVVDAGVEVALVGTEALRVTDTTELGGAVPVVVEDSLVVVSATNDEVNGVLVATEACEVCPKELPVRVLVREG
jgi:hypothetical protein